MCTSRAAELFNLCVSALGLSGWVEWRVAQKVTYHTIEVLPYSIYVITPVPLHVFVPYYLHQASQA
jgi:hypothetical protein